jgi:type VI secretion system secreted protein Hcp
MAIDVYLQIDGIKGESQDDAHKGWIECSSVNWGLSQPKSATSSTAGGHTAERFEFMRADGDGKPVKYYEVELENVLIAKCQQGVAAGDVMQEHIGLKFSKVKWKYCQQRIAGGAGGNTASGWDLAANRVAA